MVQGLGIFPLIIGLPWPLSTLYSARVTAEESHICNSNYLQFYGLYLLTNGLYLQFYGLYLLITG